MCCSSLAAHGPSLAVYTAAEDGAVVRLTGFSDGRRLPVPAELSSAAWHEFGLRGISPNRSGRPNPVTETGPPLPRIQVRGDYQIIGFQSLDETTRGREGLAVIGPGGARIILDARGKRFRPVRSGSFVSPDRRFLTVMVEGGNEKELLVLKLGSQEPTATPVEMPARVDDLRPESVTMIDGALFVVASLDGGSVLLRAPVGDAASESIEAGIIAGPVAVLKPVLAYGPAAVAYLAGDDDALLDVHVAWPSGAPLNLTSYPAPYLEHLPGSQRLAISDDASAVGYSLEDEEYGPEPETFCHPVAVPGEDGRVHLTNDERFTPYVEQEVYIFFRGSFGLVFTAGHASEMDYYLFSELSGAEIKNLTRTGSDTTPFPPGTLTPQAAAVTGSGMLLLSADGFNGRPAVVGVAADTGEQLFKEVGLGMAGGFFDVGRDSYFVATTDGAEPRSEKALGLYRVRGRELTRVAATRASADRRLVLHDSERALFYLEGVGLLELRPGAAASTLVSGDLDPEVAVSPCGDQLVYGRGGDHFVLELDERAVSRIRRAPVGAGRVLAAGEAFVRGDVSRNGRVSFEDAFQLLVVLFHNVPFGCPDAADVDDDGEVDFRDFLVLMNVLVRPGAHLPPPFPGPGVDSTVDGLSCCR